MGRFEVARSEDLREGEILATQVDRRSIIVTRVEGRAYAVENRCAHLGWSMANGKLEGSTLTCPWHGSKFDVCDGKNLDWVSAFAGIPTPKWTHGLIAMGKKPAPIASFETIEDDGKVFVDIEA